MAVINPFWLLGPAIHPAPTAAERLFVVIQINKLYADVSGSADTDFVVTGAYIAGQPAWRKFECAWGAILKDAKACEFHATDFFGYEEEFELWKGDPERQKVFSKRFTGAATRHTAFGAAFGLHRSAYDEIMEKEMRGLQRPDARVTAEVYSIVNCLAHVDDVARERGVDLPFAVILENGGRSGDAVAVLNKLKESGEPWLRRYVSFTTMPKSERPLQAADLLAHECWRHITRLNKPDGRAIRKSMEALFEGEKIHAAFADRENILTSLPGVLRGMEVHRHQK